jgi:predicted dehydrogenase
MVAATNKEKIHFAVVGAGHIGKRHIEMIERHPEADLVAISDLCSSEELGLEKVEAPLYNSLEEMLAQHPEIDVVCIATPNGLHAKQALQCLRHGKHVVVEKPMALSTADAEEMIFQSFQSSKHVFVVMQNRYSPPSMWIKELIEKNILGQIFMVQINCYWNRDERYYNGKTWHGRKDMDGGTLYTQFSHFIDIMYWLFGDITNIQARFADFNHKQLTDFEDSGMVTFDFVKGGMGSLNYSTSVAEKNFESSLTIIAERGTVKIGGQYMNEVEYCHVQGYEIPELPPSNPANNYGPYKGSAANHVYVIENVVDTLRGRSSAKTNALEGLKVVDIIERIYAQKKP